MFQTTNQSWNFKLEKVRGSVHDFFVSDFLKQQFGLMMSSNHMHGEVYIQLYYPAVFGYHLAMIMIIIMMMMMMMMMMMIHS